MNIDEAQKAYQAALNYHDIRVGTAIITLLQTGIREGELAGLEWKDIDLTKAKSTSIATPSTSAESESSQEPPKPGAATEQSPLLPT